MRGDELNTAAGMSLLEGRELVGRPVVTISRGDVVMENGRVVGTSGRGRLVTRDVVEGAAA